jgi:hypothetical protein
VGLARLRMLAAALATLGAIVGAGFGVQAVVLGRPGPAPELVAHVLAKLKSYRRSQTTMTVEGRHLTAVCTQYWQGGHRVAAAAVEHGPTIVERGNLLVENGNRLVETGRLAFVEFELAGCPRPLATWLASQVNRGGRIDVTSEELDGRPVYALSVPSAPLRLELFISRRGGLPVALSLDGAHIRGTSTLAYGVRPAVGQ